jgi:hypothetical protein
MLWALLFVGPLVLTVAILVIVFAAIKRSIDREAKSLTDVELDSGNVTIATRHPRGYRRNPGRFVLTKYKLHIIQRPQRFPHVERSELREATIEIVDGKFRIKVGPNDHRATLSDPDRWIAALRKIAESTAAK